MVDRRLATSPALVVAGQVGTAVLRALSVGNPHPTRHGPSRAIPKGQYLVQRPFEPPPFVASEVCLLAVSVSTLASDHRHQPLETV